MNKRFVYGTNVRIGIARFLGILGILLLAACPNDGLDDTAKIRMGVESGDIALFYKVIEGKTSITGDYLYKNYVQKGSLGLREFFKTKFLNNQDLTGTALDAALVKYGARMNSFLPFLKANKDAIEKNVVNESSTNRIIQKIQSDFGGGDLKIPSGLKAYFFIGGFSALGTGDRLGMFIDAAMIKGDSMDYTSLPAQFQGLVSILPILADIDFLIAHETIHTLQINNFSKEEWADVFGSPSSSLGYAAIVEGGADFLASLIIGEQAYLKTAKTRVDYTEANPGTFKNFLDSSALVLNRAVLPEPLPMPDADLSTYSSSVRAAVEALAVHQKWFYNSHHLNLGSRPPDLGYYMGYLIVKAYWEAHAASEGKSQTFLDIINSAKSQETAAALITKSGVKESGS